MPKQFLNCLALLCMLPTMAAASLDGAKAAYVRGAAKEKAKDYAGAVVEYRAALAEYPAYVYADKGIANCLYYQGDSAGALVEYDKYLKAIPSDVATKGFADRLRSQFGTTAPVVVAPVVVAAPPAPAQAPLKLNDRPFNDTMYIGAGFGFMLDDGADWKKLIGSTLTLDTRFASLYDLKLGYQMANGFAIEGSFKYGPLRTMSVKNGFFTLGFSANQMSGMVEPIYRFKVDSNLSLGAGLGLGYGMVSITSAGATGSDSGSGMVLLPEIKAQRSSGNWVLELDAGYHWSDLSPIKDQSGGTVTDSSGGNWHVQDSGPYLRVGVAYAFNTLMN